MKPNQFWTSGLLNKRLVVFPETNNSKIVMSELIKTITGGDPVRIEQKGKQAYTALLRCKLIIVSNSSPTLTSTDADQRRIILCRVSSKNKSAETDYEDRLWDEAPYIIGCCREAYMRHAQTRGVIPVNRDLAELEAAESEQQLCDLFEQNFVNDANSSMTGSDLLYTLRQAGVTKSMDISHFHAYAARKYNIRKKRGNNCIYYYGMRAKIGVERAGAAPHVRLVNHDA
jgi:phage/plasmid-associated DNA primase